MPTTALTVDSFVETEPMINVSGSSRFGQVDIKEINVDHRYQRIARINRVKYMSRNFDPRLIGSLVVSLRGDGSYWVIDGQHRLETLRNVYDEEFSYAVDCMIYEGLSVEEEAELFWKLQDSRRNVSSVEKFLAKITQGDPKAMMIMEAMAEANVRLVSSNGQSPPRSTRAIKAVEDVYDWVGYDGLLEVFGLINVAWGDDQQAYYADVIQGVGAFVRKFKGGYDRKVFANKLSGVTVVSIRQMANLFKTGKSNSEGKALGKALSEVYNKGRTSGTRISWDR